MQIGHKIADSTYFFKFCVWIVLYNSVKLFSKLKYLFSFVLVNLKANTSAFVVIMIGREEFFLWTVLITSNSGNSY